MTKGAVYLEPLLCRISSGYIGTFPMEESVLVAGPGIEPGSGGYEPPEVPLLYPAMY